MSEESKGNKKADQQSKATRKRRRAIRGAGSVYRRESDGRYVGSFLVEETGKRKYIYADTEQEAHKKLQQALLEQKQGLLNSGKQQKLKDYLNQWLEEVHKPTIKESSYMNYRANLDNHIIPALGHIHLHKLTPDQVQSFYARKLKAGLSPSTIYALHAVLRKALDNAIRWGRISRNVCDLVSLPRKPKHEIQPLTEEQAKTLLQAVQGHKLETLLMLALFTGMRRGELLALRWQDINLDSATLHIRRSVNYRAKHGYMLTEPKTAKGKRTISLPQTMVTQLLLHRSKQLEQRSKMGDRWQEKDLVFCNQRGSFINPMDLVTRFDVILKEAGLPDIRFHDLRHSAATLLLSMGIHPKVVQERLGHSQISMTMDVYSHVLPSIQQEAANKIDDLFRPQN